MKTKSIPLLLSAAMIAAALSLLGSPVAAQASAPTADPDLYSAVWRGQADRVRELIAAGADVNTVDDDGDPLLHEAIWRGHTEIVQILVDAGADVNTVDDDGDPLLHEAIWRGHTQTVWILVNAGADVNATAADGDSMLHEASWRGHSEIESILKVAMRDVLIAAQESLLNTYRCQFNVDTQVVPGGCADSRPTMGDSQRGVLPKEPTQQDVSARDDLVAAQESLLNTYRCQFNTDTQIVPGGCASRT